MTTTLSLIPTQTVVATNFMTNPSAEVSIYGYSIGGPGGLPTGTLTQVLDGSSGRGDYSVRATFTSPDNNPAAGVDAGGIYYDLPTDDKPTGTVWSAQAVFKSSRVTALRMSIEWQSSTSTVLATTVGTPVQMLSGAAAYYTVKVENSTVPAGATRMRIKFYAANTTGFSRWQAGDTLTLDTVLVMQATNLTGQTYFDGDTASNGTYRYSWLGMRGRSVSVRTQASGSPYTITPLLMLGYTASRRTNSSVHTVPGAQYDPVTLRFASSRSGSFKFLFATADDAAAVESLVGSGRPVLLYDDEQPVVNMTFVLGDGKIDTALDNDTGLWTVEFPFVEQAAG